MKLALDRYVEEWETLMDDRWTNPTGNRGSDVLLMFKLKVMALEKCREEVKVLNVAAPMQMLDRLRELATRERKGREALEAPSVEAEFKEAATDGGEKVPMGTNPRLLPPRIASPAPGSPVSAQVEPPEPPRKPGKWQQERG
jgi:hypothetical protein